MDAPLPQACPGRVGHDGGQVGGQLSGSLNLSTSFSFNPLEFLIVRDTWRGRVEGGSGNVVARYSRASRVWLDTHDRAVIVSPGPAELSRVQVSRPGGYGGGRYSRSGHTGSMGMQLLLWSMSRLGWVLVGARSSDTVRKLRLRCNVNRINNILGLGRQAGAWRGTVRHCAGRGAGHINVCCIRLDFPEELTIALGNPTAAINLYKIGVMTQTLQNLTSFRPSPWSVACLVLDRDQVPLNERVELLGSNR